jgi:hypothetical protein
VGLPASANLCNPYMRYRPPSWPDALYTRDLFARLIADHGRHRAEGTGLSVRTASETFVTAMRSGVAISVAGLLRRLDSTLASFCVVGPWLRPASFAACALAEGRQRGVCAHGSRARRRDRLAVRISPEGRAVLELLQRSGRRCVPSARRMRFALGALGPFGAARNMCPWDAPCKPSCLQSRAATEDRCISRSVNRPCSDIGAFWLHAKVSPVATGSCGHAGDAGEVGGHQESFIVISVHDSFRLFLCWRVDVNLLWC